MKLFTIITSAVVLLGLASCKKSYTCKCTGYYWYDKGRTKPQQITTDTIRAFRKKKVDPLCEKEAENYILNRNPNLDSLVCYAFAFK
jgi:hypothetical protein